MPYMSVSAINSAVDHIIATYPAIAQPIALPEPSVEARPIKALKIANGTGTNRTGVLYLGGTHARELINPELLVSFALRLCEAYTHNTGLAFGPKSYEPSAIQVVVNGLDIFLVPMVNPDGREFCLVPGGYAMWRKNRRPPSGAACPGLPANRKHGVDLNRNYDLLWSSGIGTSADSCNDVYKGPSAFSEPETRNVRWMIDSFRNIACMIDVHSYSELVLYPWGDDENQTTTASENFQNPAFDGLRGIVGSGYREYIPAEDRDAHVAAGERIRDGIAAVRGRTYTVEQSIFLYPTSGTSHDFAYARKFVDTGRRRILGFTVETAREFQPVDSEKDQVISEVSAGLMEGLLETLCPAEAVQALIDAVFPLQAMRDFRDRQVLKTAGGKRYEHLLRAHSVELVRLIHADEAALKAAAALLGVAGRFVTAKGVSSRKIATVDLTEVAQALAVIRKRAGKALKAAIDGASADLQKTQGRTLTAAVKALDRGGRLQTNVRPARAARRRT